MPATALTQQRKGQCGGYSPGGCKERTADSAFTCRPSDSIGYLSTALRSRRCLWRRPRSMDGSCPGSFSFTHGDGDVTIATAKDPPRGGSSLAVSLAGHGQVGEIFAT